ncbi:MAG: CopD family protein, partial [Burkholderiales bacterium]|nr:CopD family protein [Burkholderiales bacterium]
GGPPPHPPPLMGVRAFLAGSAEPARAPAQLVSAMPGEGAVLAVPPPVLALRFNEPVRPVAVRLLGPDGTPVDATVRGLGATIEIVPAASLVQGAYVVSYRVVSADGHPVAGALPFSIGQGSGGSALNADPGAANVALVIAARVMAYAGLLFGVGGAAAVAWLGPAAPVCAAPARRVARVALVVGAAGYGAGVLLLGRELADGWAGAPVAAAGTTFARSAALWAVAAFVAAGALAASGRSAKSLSTVALVGAGAALATTGHAATAPPAWAALPSLFLHGVAATLWAGPLPFLATVLARRDPALPIVLRRFSSMVIVAVAVLAAAGTTIAALQLRAPSDLLETDYGRILAIKLALVASLLGLAAINRIRLTPAASAGSAVAAVRLRRNVLVEIVVIAAVAVVIAAWRFTPPPRALTAVLPLQRQVHLHGAQAMVDVVFSPGRVGPNRLAVVPMSPDFAPLAAKEVVVTLGLAAAGIEGLERKVVPTSDGPWIAEGLTLPLPGRWSVRVSLLVTDFDKIVLKGEIEIPGAPPP